jgi:hypothetical protein
MKLRVAKLVETGNHRPADSMHRSFHWFKRLLNDVRVITTQGASEIVVRRMQYEPDGKVFDEPLLKNL